MRSYSATEAKIRFGEFLACAQSEPVRVIRKGKVAGVMVSAADYEAMQSFFAERLRKTLDECARNAVAVGLTEARLSQLLADES
ncbi:MAG: type II toxin-antitoxin system Phd/YefM family antitoxin [Gallionella sp.]|nr:type II toxin-antitoxin system Phd/YefM family antitoxin [Gallionella sp.]